MKFDDAISKLSKEEANKVMNAESLEEIIQIFRSNNLDVTETDVYEAIKIKSQELDDEELS